ncbi:MAG: S41 family peptidase [Pseudoflavonifractor sp.]|nr:S41 family peptidase [Alloprevotella sp.]MCM1116563.1 S41 family peptidase [Pseudoflavonifractor sp.]
MRHILMLAVASIAMLSAIASNPSYKDIESLITHVGEYPDAKATPVDYTGGWPVNGAAFGFTMMRGSGKGITEGLRLTIPHPSDNLVDSALAAYGGSWGFIYMMTCADDSAKIAYSLYLDEANDTLFLLRVSFESEPSIPIDWYQRAHYNAAEMETTPTAKQPKPEVNWEEAMTRLYDEVKYNFVFYGRIAHVWDRAYRKGKRELAMAKDDYERARAIQRMVARCKDGHTMVYFYGDFETPGSSPFTTVKLPEGLFVRSVESRELIDAGMRRGQRITAVNGETPEEWAKRELLPYVCSSTPQWTEHMMYDDYHFSRVRNGSDMNLTLEDAGGDVIEVAHRVNKPRWDPSLAVRGKRSFSIRENNIGLLTIPDFQTSEVVEFFDSIYPLLASTDGLIIDLRGNGGGNSGFSDHIAGHLVAKPAAKSPWTSRMYIPAFASWGMDERVYHAKVDSVYPKMMATYDNPVALLTDRATFSAAEDFCALLRDAGRAIIIGTETGGSTGNGVRPILTGGGAIRANICSKHDVSPDGTEFVGIGIIPDIRVEERAASYFDPERDDVIEAAVIYLTGQRDQARSTTVMPAPPRRTSSSAAWATPGTVAR